MQQYHMFPESQDNSYNGSFSYELCSAIIYVMKNLLNQNCWNLY